MSSLSLFYPLYSILAMTVTNTGVLITSLQESYIYDGTNWKTFATTGLKSVLYIGNNQVVGYNITSPPSMQVIHMRERESERRFYCQFHFYSRHFSNLFSSLLDSLLSSLSPLAIHRQWKHMAKYCIQFNLSWIHRSTCNQWIYSNCCRTEMHCNSSCWYVSIAISSLFTLIQINGMIQSYCLLLSSPLSLSLSSISTPQIM